jgi:hypothetical protein
LPEPAAPASELAAGVPSPLPEMRAPEHPHAVFDRMGRSVPHANTFNLGRIDIDRQFSDIETGLDLLEIERQQRVKISGLPAIAARPRHIDLRDDELAADLSAMGPQPLVAPAADVRQFPSPAPSDALVTALPPDVHDDAGAIPGQPAPTRVPRSAPTQRSAPDDAAAQALSPAEVPTVPAEAAGPPVPARAEQREESADG